MTDKWFYANFDSHVVSCKNCKTKYSRNKVQRKNKCPKCGLDNHGMLKESVKDEQR